MPKARPKLTAAGRLKQGDFRYTLISIISLLSFFLVWQLLCSSGLVSDRYLSTPIRTVLLFFDKLTNSKPDGNTLGVNVLTSLQVSMSGFVLAAGIGVPLGLLMGWYKGIDKFVRPLFEILRPIPPVAWIPFTILWLGIGLWAKAFIIFFTTMVPCVINSYTGVKLTNKTLINVAKTCGASNFQIFLKVAIPSSLPVMFAGLRIAIGNAWGCLVAAEMLAANAGLGFMIAMGRQFVRPDIIVLGMLVIGIVGVLFAVLVSLLERKLVGWRATK